MRMPLVRGFVHFAALLALGALAMAFGRWLREPSIGSLAALLIAVAVVAVCLRRLYGPAGPATLSLRKRRPAPDSRAEAPPPETAEAREPLWATPAAGIDLNRATAEELTALPGVGPVSGRRIVADREANGPFGSVEELARVDGFGPAKVRALGNLVRV